MPRRKRPRPAPRPVPIDVLLIGVVTAVLWGAWPAAPAPRPGVHRALPSRPSVAFVKADFASSARNLLYETPFRDRASRHTAMPDWSDIASTEPPPSPTPMTAALPPAPPLELPVPPDPATAESGAASVASSAPPIEPPAWDLEVSGPLLAAGLHLEEDALLRASSGGSPSGECSADLVLGPDGLPESVLLDPSSAAPFTAETRVAMTRALLLARLPGGGERLVGRVRWKWRTGSASDVPAVSPAEVPRAAEPEAVPAAPAEAQSRP